MDRSGTVTGAWHLTSIATEAGGELWSPDGKNILFTSDVYPECDGHSKGSGQLQWGQVERGEDSKVKAQIFDRLLYRHWNAYKRGQSKPHFRRFDSLRHTPTERERLVPSMRPGWRDLTPGDYDSPVFSLGGQDDYAFSPDGQEVCYTSNHDKVEATSTNNDLWIVPVDGRFARAKNITSRQSRQRLDAALFSRWQVHRLPRPAASGRRERSLSADAVRPEDGREEESDGRFRSLGWHDRLDP